MLDCQVAKKLSYLGKISPNQGTLVLDNIQSYTLSALENQTVQLKDDDDTVFFTGVTLKGKTSVDKKTVQLPIRDKWYSIRDTACTNKTWKNTSLQTIIEDIIDMTGETSYSVANPSITVSWFSVSVDDKVRDVLEELARSLAAYCYYDSAGTLQFTAGFNSSFSTSTAATLTNSEVSSVTIDSKTDEYDYSEVSFAKKEFKGNKEEVYNGANSTNHWLVESGGVGVSEDYYVELDKRIYELEAYADVAFTADAELTLDSTVYNSNFQSGSQPSQDNIIKIKIANSSGITKDISEFVIEGKAIREVRGTATYSSGNRVLQLTSDVVDDATWAGKLAQYSLEQSTGVENLNINLAELDYTLDIADKITYDSARYVIDSISMTAKSVRITGFKDRDSAFSYTSSDVRYIRSSETDIAGDGLDPEAPTGLSLSTEQPAGEYVSEITATWTASTSIDVVKYIVEYKKQGVVWGDASKSETNGLSLTVEAEPITWYDFKVRALDVEEKESSWTSYESIKSADVDGDGSDPNSYVFDDSECEAVVLNGKRYAHLKWMPESTASPDVKNFHIRYGVQDGEIESFYVTSVDALVYVSNTGYSTKTIPGDTFEAYIEIPTIENWGFMLYVEDYDGNFYNSFVYSFVSGDQTDDAVISLDFSSATIGDTPGIPAITGGTGFLEMIRVTFTPPANVQKNWILETQVMVSEGNWGSSQYFNGKESYQWKSGKSYYVKYYTGSIAAYTNIGMRIRFVNNGVAGGWAYTAEEAYPHPVVPSQPDSISVSSSTVGGTEVITLTCPEVTNTHGYDWLISNSSSGTGIEKEGSTTEPSISFFGPHAADWNYALVRAKNGAGESAWRYVSTGW
jgi:hypothetical protein